MKCGKSLGNKHKSPLKSTISEGFGPRWETRTPGLMVPKQAHYQLRYTRLLSCFIRLGVFSQTTRATNCANPGYDREGCRFAVYSVYIIITGKYRSVQS